MNNIWAAVLAIVFGIIIIIVPAIVAYLIGIYLIVWGVSRLIQQTQKKQSG